MTSIDPCVEHVFKHIMYLDDEEIQRVTSLKYDSWRNISHCLRHEQLKHDFDNKHISMGIYKCFLPWLYYYMTYKPDKSNVMSMDDTIYDNVDMDALEASFREKFPSATVSPHEDVEAIVATVMER